MECYMSAFRADAIKELKSTEKFVEEKYHLKNMC